MTTETNTSPKDKASTTINRAALPMMALAVPLVFESIFRILVASVDTLMLSSFSQESVAGVGLVTQYIFFIQLLFTVICTGASIVLSQYLGARRMEESRQVAQASAVMTLVAGLCVAVAVLLGAKPLLSAYSIEESVRNYGWQFLVIYGGVGSVFMAFNMLQGAILRSYGYTKDAMVIAMATNLVNVIGNSFALYGWFGLPVTGVIGVSTSSAFAQAFACVALAWRIKAHPDVQFSFRGWTKVPKDIYRRILSIGVPTAGESISYNIGQIVIMAMVATLGTYAMSAQVYTQTIVRFVFVTAMSIGNAVQIKTGYFVGSGHPEAAYRRLYKYQAIGTGISLGLVLLLNLVKGPVIGVFTHVPEIASITYAILFVSIYVETGRSINLITIPALKGAGDVKFPVFVGILSMWGIGVFGSWLFGIKLGFGMLGIWAAVGTDETFRGVSMLFRWKSKRWQTKAIA